ncbi:hypothetical protein H4R19_002646 [Coemansia spiralis]|nr:hypothetical protein H4R19_002646 [Coemansia spiralis]
MSDATHVTLVKYESGLGRPGIVPPRVSSSIEITAPADGVCGKVVKQVYENNRPGDTQEGELSDTAIATVLGLVSSLCALPVRESPGGPDVFGANTVAIVRKGKTVVWGYNPGAGCAVGPDTDTDSALLAVTDEHRATFVDVVSRLYEASEASI